MTLHVIPAAHPYPGMTRLTINGRTFACPGDGPDAKAKVRALAKANGASA